MYIKMTSKWRALRTKRNAQWRGYSPFSLINIEAKNVSKWFPSLKCTGLLAAATVFKKDLPKDEVQPGNIFQKRSQKGPFHRCCIIAIILFFDSLLCRLSSSTDISVTVNNVVNSHWFMINWNSLQISNILCFSK